MATQPVSRRGFLKLGGLGMAVGGLALAGCGQGGQAPAASSTATNGRQQINFVTAKFESTTSMQSFVDAYNQSQGTYQVVVRELPPPSSSTEVHQQLVQQLGSTGSGIDVFTQDVIWIAEFASGGWAMDLTSEFSDADRSAFFPGLVDACTVDGKLRALPFYLDAGALYYRQDLLSGAGIQPPTTWDELTTAAQQLTGSGAARLGFLWQAKQAEILVCDLVEFVGSAGGSILAPDGRTVQIAEEPAVRAVQYMHDTMNRLAITPKDVLSWDEEPSRKPFTSGDAAFLRQWSYVWKVSQDQSQSSVVGKVAVVPAAGVPGREERGLPRRLPAGHRRELAAEAGRAGVRPLDDLHEHPAGSTPTPSAARRPGRRPTTTHRWRRPSRPWSNSSRPSSAAPHARSPPSTRRSAWPCSRRCRGR